MGIFAEKIGFAIFCQLENPWYIFIEKTAKDGTEKKYISEICSLLDKKLPELEKMLALSKIWFQTILIDFNRNEGKFGAFLYPLVSTVE